MADDESLPSAEEAAQDDGTDASMMPASEAVLLEEERAKHARR